MRKFLGLLVAAVFVAVAASSAMAQTFISTNTTNGYAMFSAEVLFVSTGTAQFGFDLYRMAAGSSRPASGDATAPKIDWMGLSGVTAGIDATVPSHVYAKVVNEANTAKTAVYFYTNNASTAAFGAATGPTLPAGSYHYAVDAGTVAYGVGSPQTINALVEKDGSTGLNTSAGAFTLPLAFRVEVSSTVDTAPTYDVTAQNWSDDTLGQLFYVTDVSKTAKPADGTDPASTAFDPAYAQITSPAGMRTYNTGFAFSEVQNWYFFFASNFHNARNGYSYGTDSLTVQVIIQP